MMRKDELDQEVSQGTLERFLKTVHSELNEIDFKQYYSLESSKEKAELVRDVLAFANTAGGGHIIFGVEDGTGNPVGLHEAYLDMTKIHNVLSNYITAPIDYRVNQHYLQWPIWPEPRRFGIIYIAESPTIVVPHKQVAYEENNEGGKKRTKIAVDTHQIVVRLGAQSVVPDQATLAQLVERKHIYADDVQPLHSLEGNLPAREDISVEFIGRRKELEELRTWFDDPNSKTWMLTGDGGKGKTAIAYEFATELKGGAPKNFEYILWLSAKSRRYQGGSVRNIDPNFWDYPSLVDAIVRGYGFDDEDYANLTELQKRDQAKTLLSAIPALIIADDIDSLEPKHEKAILFLISDIASTPSKVLFTSRRVPFGFGENYTYVEGLNGEDGRSFIYSRIRRSRFDMDMFPPRRVDEILQVTDGSPLYIEDLLRLCAFLSVEDAIRVWKKYAGHEARRYALEREFELLNSIAKDIVFACCIPDVALSLVEIKVITGMSEEQVTSEMSVIQDLFLISRLRLIDGEPRFDVNTNTRRLILETYDKHPRLVELKERYKGLAGRLNVRQGDIQSYIQKAISLQLMQDHETAEKLLTDALQRYPNNADLTAQLGVIYYHWRPNRRLTDAQQQFKLAQQLGCQQEWMYRRWVQMESNAQDWAKAAEVADTGINEGITSKELYALAGIAHSHLGNQFKNNFFFDKTEKEFKMADRLLRKGLKAPEHLINYSDRKLNSRVYRALTISCDALGQIDDMLHFLDKCQHEHEDDPDAWSEGQRLREKHSLTH